MYRSILLPPEVLPAFGCFKCSDLTHPIAASIFDNTNVPNVADCVLEEKWAIVNQAGKWGISHENCIEEIYPLKFWNDAYVAPVDMTALVSSHKGVAEMEMEKLKVSRECLSLVSMNLTKLSVVDAPDQR